MIAQHLKSHGFELGERAVRYHLKLLDERGLTYLVGKRDGRELTEKGREEVRSAMVKDKVGFVISKINTLSFRATFDCDTRTGLVPVNLSFFPKDSFAAALKIMKPVFEAGLCVSDLVAIAPEGERLGDIIVPPGKMGLATVCSIIFNSTLLKNGVPIDSRFGGLLQLRDKKPRRFVELIDYNGCSLDPSTIFLRARMTSVSAAVASGEGSVLANFREVPAVCLRTVEKVITSLHKAGFKGFVLMGDVSEPVFEIPVPLNKIGIVLLGGLNPVAAAEEAGIVTDNMAMSTTMDYGNLAKFHDVIIDYRDLVKFWESSR